MYHDVSLLDVREICARCSISRPSLYRLLQRGRFPRPCFPGGLRTPRWRSDAVAAWIEAESAQVAGGIRVTR